MRKIQSSILLLILCISFSHAQENDFQIWSSISAKDQVTYKTDLFLKHSLRFRENASLLSTSFSEIKLKYKYNKKTSIALGFRDINKWDTKLELEKKNRYFLDISYRKKKKRFYFFIRNRIQYQESLESYSAIFRQKISCRYNIRKTKMEPLIALEYFLNEYNYIRKLRYTMAVSFPILKNTDLALLYRIQNSLYVSNLEDIYIFEVKLAYDL
jgi:hypothetical protein